MPIHRHRDEEGRHLVRRLIHPGEEFDTAELDADQVELEAVPATPEPPEDEQAEPWGLAQVAGKALDRLRAYRAAHPAADDPEDQAEQEVPF